MLILSKHNCIACIEAERKIADEGLMLDPNGFISTCNSTNFLLFAPMKYGHHQGNIAYTESPDLIN